MPRAHQWLLFLIPAVLCAGGPRFARVGAWQGDVRVQVHAYDSWRQAVRNAPLVESSRIESGALSRVEIELDEGSAFRLLGDALAEISDYSQLSTGQRITLISLDHGTAYFTGQPGANDSVGVSIPGAHVVLQRASTVRFAVSDGLTEIAILAGTVRFSTPAAEMDLRQGQWIQLDPANHSKFKLLRDIPELASDKWTDPRAGELEHAGHWIHTDDVGLVWKPKVADTWAPFQTGEWRWYEELGYTWIAAEPWGWKPYHYGRWLQHASLGWVWVQAGRQTFKPGEVYWMSGSNLMGWGALAPGEEWVGMGHPRQYAALNTALGHFTAGVHEFGPDADLPRPKDLLTGARFSMALPSPPMIASRLDAARPSLRSAGTKLISFAGDAVSVPGVSYSDKPPAAAVPPAKPPAAIPRPTPLPPTRVNAVPPPPVVVEVVEPMVVYYPYPVYSGYVILNPPVKKKDPKDKWKQVPPNGGS